MRWERLADFPQSLWNQSVTDSGQKSRNTIFWPAQHSTIPGQQRTKAISGKPGDPDTDSNPSLRLGLLPGLLEEIELPQRFLLGLHGDSFVIAGGVNRDMAQPVLNHGQADAGGKEMAGRGAPPPMNRMCFFLFDSRRFAGCCGQVLAAEVVKAGARQASMLLIDK
jgi:hypothetical protein